MTHEQKKEMLPYALWFNLIIGFWNLYLFVDNYWWFNLVIGSLNIGVWVFNRDTAMKLWK